RARFIVPYLHRSIDARRPVYTVSTVTDVGGVPVSYERLVLPFGAAGTVQHLIASLKTISIEGRFATEKPMRGDNKRPRYSVCAVIDRDPQTAQPRMTVTDEIVEI